MENILLNAFSEHLSNLIIGFRRDQINSNLLTGRGEITSVDLNCSILNDILRSYTPLAELESVHVTKLGFNVTSFTNIKKAPIEVLIDEIHVKLVEPLHHTPYKATPVDPTGGGTAASSSSSTDGTKRAAYGLFDRIGDNITVEINRIFVTFQPLGKFKTRRTGPWTPPALGVTLRNFRYVSVDEFGEEGTPEQVWRHNDRDRRIRRAGGGPHDIFIYKKLSLNCSLGLRPAVLDGGKPATKLLLRSVPVEVHITMQKRKNDAAFLAAQSDVSVDNVQIELDDHSVPLLAHMLAAARHLVAKDRTFVDPLKPDGSGGDGSEGGGGEGGVMVLDESVEMTLDEEEDKGLVKAKLAQQQQADEEENESLADDASSSSSEEEDEEDITMDASATTDASSQQQPVGQQIPGVGGKNKFYPAYVFQSGIIILNRISISLSVHHCTVRAWYPNSMKGGGYLQCVLKGLVTEAIWPPRPGERGGIGQVSLSYISLQERYGKALRPMLIGGQQLQSVGNMMQSKDGEPDMMAAPPEITFPLFEERSIRTDGYGRDSAPSQAIGLKCTIDIQDKNPLNPVEGKTKMSFLNEIGMDRIDVTLDADAYCRALSFCLNGEEGFDKRWYSGDWADWLSADMFVTPPAEGGIPSLEPFLQPLPEIFLNEEHLVSSDLFNLTSKMTNLRLRLPAPVHKDVKSSSVIISLSDMMLLVSSVLPKTILCGKISPSEDEEKNTSFPNDPSDISANLSQVDNLICSGYAENEMRSSTFRVQLTMEGFSVRATPAIPLHDAPECESLVSPTKMSCLVCLDIKAPPSAHTRKGMAITVHVSTLMHRLETNVDFDVVTSLTSTILYHIGVIKEAAKSLQPSAGSTNDKVGSEGGGGGSLDKVLKSQVSQSMESGIVAFLFCLHIPDLDLRLWRQECVMKDPGGSKAQGLVQPALLLARIRLKLLQVGVEAAKGLHDAEDSKLRVIFKLGLSALGIDLCDPSAVVSLADDGTSEGEKSNHASLLERIDAHLKSTTEVLVLGSLCENDDDEEVQNLIRIDYDGHSESVACGIEITSAGAFQLKLNAVEQVIAQVIEALFVPTGIHPLPEMSQDVAEKVGARSIFPSGSIGSFFAALCWSQADMSTVSSVPEAPSGTAATTLLNSIKQFAFRFSAEQIALAVPTIADGGVSLYYSLQLSKSSAVLGYFQELEGETRRIKTEEWTNRCSGTNHTWASHFRDHATGMHLSFSSHQGLSHSTDPQGSLILLVPPFGVDGHYHPNSTALSMGKVDLTFEEAQVLKRFTDALAICSRNGYAIFEDVVSLQASLEVKSDKEKKTVSSNAAQVASNEALSSIAVAQSLLKAIDEDLNARKVTVQSNIADKQQELEKAKILLFLKERQRVAALSLVSSKVCGWMRMGSANQSGQRIITTTSLWRYWAILRKNLLIISDRPGGSKPVDIVPLRDVTMHSITGGNRRTDLQRGFALVDGSGYERFFSCSTGDEYEMWIGALSDIVKVAKSSRQEARPVAEAATEPSQEVDVSAVSAETNRDEITTDEPASQSYPPPMASIATPQRARLPSGDSSSTDRRQLLKSKLTAVKDTTKSSRLMQKMAEAKASANAKLGEAATAVRTASELSADQQRSDFPDGEKRFGRRIASMKTAVQTVRAERQIARGPSTPTRSQLRESSDEHGPSRAGEEAGPPSQPDLSISETTADESLLSFDEDASIGDESHQMRRKLGDRMSKFGTTVKSVKIDGSKLGAAMKSVKLDSQALTRLNSSSFQHPGNDDNDTTPGPLRRRFRDSVGSGLSGSDGDRPSLRIKSLRSLQGGPSPKQDDLPQVELKRIPGKWNFKVQALRVQEDEAEKPEVTPSSENSSEVAASLPVEAVASEDAAEVEDINAESDVSASVHQPDAFNIITEAQEQPMNFPWIYEISLDYIQTHHPQEHRATLTKSLSDILHFYSQISESTSTVRGYDEEYECQDKDELDFSTISAALCSQLAVTGRILEGIIELDEHMMEHEDVRAYQCEVLSIYFDAILASPLPKEAICATFNFFEMKGEGIAMDLSKCISRFDFNLPVSFKPLAQESPSSETFDSILKLVSSCEAELARASRTSLVASNLATTTSFPRLSRAPESVELLRRPGDKKDALQLAMHNALISAMTERDEAHAQLVAASVLHVHEMEQERKKIDSLTRKLVVAEKLNAEANIGGTSFFLGSDEIPGGKDSLLKQERDMMQNTDDELLAMCRQLSSEISEKTAAALEIVRLQESNKIEREAEKARRDEMQKEIDELRRQLQSEKAKGAEAKKSAIEWKQSFHEAALSGFNGSEEENGR